MHDVTVCGGIHQHTIPVVSRAAAASTAVLLPCWLPWPPSHQRHHQTACQAAPHQQSQAQHTPPTPARIGTHTHTQMEPSETQPTGRGCALRAWVDAASGMLQQNMQCVHTVLAAVRYSTRLHFPPLHLSPLHSSPKNPLPHTSASTHALHRTFLPPRLRSYTHLPLAFDRPARSPRV